MKVFDEEFYRKRVNTFPFVRLMGMKLVSAGGGKSVMECKIRPILKNSAGTLHGGVMGALVDMSVATALRSVMPLPSKMTTVEYKVNFLKPVPSGTVTAYGNILRLGRTIAVGSTEIRNGDGEVVAFGSATYYILHVRAAEVPAVGSPPAIMKKKSLRGRKLL
ncbi:MAG: PaaI family thioesterase [Deltaproteobacteria bacterium]|nr:PaaI family thioesterase [Deltaproteobacteria bacterium]